MLADTYPEMNLVKGTTTESGQKDFFLFIILLF